MVEFVAQSNRQRVNNGVKPSAINYIAAIFAAIGSFLFGYDSGIISSIISPGYDQFIDYFHKPGDQITGAIGKRAAQQ